MDRVFNFSAGPSMLPLPVLEKAASEMTNYEGTGMSVMEMSHRSPAFDEIINNAETGIRKLMNISDDYDVLFLQGGASTQFAAVPLNLMNKNKKADYVLSGNFSTKAYKEATKYGDAVVAATTKDINFSKIPDVTSNIIRKDADYVHICFNNTIFGTTYHYIPDIGNIPLVADMSSCILSEPCDVSKFSLIYAGAQKNMAPAGLTVVIVKKDILGNAMDITPSMLNYQLMADHKSMYNTPPCYCIYIAKLVYDYLLSIGGLDEMKKRNVKKSDLLYDYLDNQKYYLTSVDKNSRSMMNVTFVTGNDDLDKKFCSEAAANGLMNLKGHRLVGGMRASIYNAMPYEGVVKLVEFMDVFSKNNQKKI